MTITVNNPDSFTTYPNHRVLGIIEDRNEARSTLDALLAAGINEGEIEVFYGQSGAEVLDADTEHHGVMAKIAKFLRAFGDVENEALRVYETALKEGYYVFGVPANNESEKETVRHILAENGARDLNYFDTWVVESLEAA